MPRNDIAVRTRTRPSAGPLQDVLASISNKWVVTVCELLTSATELSYGELHRRTNGASRKMLSATLRDLVRDGLVDRRLEAGPLSQRVYYRLTDLGRSLVGSLAGLRAWADTHMDIIQAARRNSAFITG